MITYLKYINIYDRINIYNLTCLITFSCIRIMLIIIITVYIVKKRGSIFFIRFRHQTSPDRHYSMWIQSCGCLNDLDGVEKVVQEMKGDSSWDTFANLASI